MATFEQLITLDYLIILAHTVQILSGFLHCFLNMRSHWNHLIRKLQCLWVNVQKWISDFENIFAAPFVICLIASDHINADSRVSNMAPYLMHHLKFCSPLK